MSRFHILRSWMYHGTGQWPHSLSEEESLQILIASPLDSVFVEWNNSAIRGVVSTLHPASISTLQVISSNIASARYSYVSQTGRSLKFVAAEMANGLYSFQREAKRGGVSSKLITLADKRLTANVRDAVQALLGSDTPISISIKISFLETVPRNGGVFQDPHIDFSSRLLLGSPLGERFIAFFPLKESGMFVQMWDRTTSNAEGKVVFIPIGSLYVVPAGTVHGGGFKTFGPDNGRGHLYIWAGIDPDLSFRNDYFDIDQTRLSGSYMPSSVLGKLDQIWPN
jgi:hypothetical protein